MKPDAQVMAFPGAAPCYIEKDYKTRLLMKFSALSLAGTAFFCAAFYFNLNRRMGGGYISVLDGMRFMKQNVLMNFVFTETGILLFLGAGVTLLTLLMSHRIAGPLWRLEQTANAVGAGDFTLKVKLRDKDQLKDLADQVNSMIKGLNGLAVEVRDAYWILEADVLLLGVRSRSDDCTSDAECAAIIRDILDSTRVLREKLAVIEPGDKEGR
jgi:methyl-accepting chemotaxis protein